MKKYFKTALLLILAALLSSLSCARMTKEDYDSIRGRSFCFNGFLYHRRMIDNQKAFRYMKGFPVNRVLKIMEHRYGITIDSSAYDIFMSVNDENRLTTSGILSTLNYSWQGKTSCRDIIELEIAVNEGSEPSIEARCEFNILLKLDNSKKFTVSGSIGSMSDPLPSIAKRLGYRLADSKKQRPLRQY